MAQKLPALKPSPTQIVEAFNNTLMISNLIEGYIENNNFVRYKKGLLKKANRARKLIDELHQSAHGSFQMESTLVKGKCVTKIICK